MWVMEDRYMTKKKTTLLCGVLKIILIEIFGQWTIGHA